MTPKYSKLHTQSHSHSKSKGKQGKKRSPFSHGNARFDHSFFLRLLRSEMKTRGYAIEITNLSANTTEKDVYDFLAFCGSIQNVQLVRAGDSACIAYVTFKNPHAVETAVLLSGDTILDQPVRITQWGRCDDNYNIQNRSSWKIEDDSSRSHSVREKTAPSAGKAVSLAQDTVKTVAAKGFGLGKDAVVRAKAFGESHQVTAAAVAKVSAGIEAARYVDQRYHISGTTRSAVSVTQKTAVSAANAMVSSSYFSKGALWLSGALDRASQVAADLGNRGVAKDGFSWYITIHNMLCCSC